MASCHTALKGIGDSFMVMSWQLYLEWILVHHLNAFKTSTHSLANQNCETCSSNKNLKIFGTEASHDKYLSPGYLGYPL